MFGQLVRDFGFFPRTRAATSAPGLSVVGRLSLPPAATRPPRARLRRARYGRPFYTFGWPAAKAAATPRPRGLAGDGPGVGGQSSPAARPRRRAIPPSVPCASVGAWWAVRPPSGAPGPSGAAAGAAGRLGPRRKRGPGPPLPRGVSWPWGLVRPSFPCPGPPFAVAASRLRAPHARQCGRIRTHERDGTRAARRPPPTHPPTAGGPPLIYPAAAAAPLFPKKPANKKSTPNAKKFE